MGIANPIVVNRPTMTVDTKSIANGLTSIKAQPNVLIRLVDSNTGIAPSKIRVKRNGQNLDVEIENGQQDGQADFVIENYYDVQGIDVIGQAADGSYYQFLPESGSASDAINGLSLSNEASQTIPGGVQSQVVAAPVSTDPVAPVVVQPSGGKGFSPWMLLGGLGLAGLAAGGGGSSKDTTAPSAATVAAPDNTNNNKPAITGTGEAGATVTVVIKDSKGAEQTVTGTVAANGQWSVTPTTAIADGTYSATATLKDAAGNVSVPASDNGSIDTVAPVTGSMTAAKLTNDNTPTISGEGAEVGVSGTILIKDAKGVEQSITIAVGADGKWSATPPNALADGPYTVSATFKDTAGNASAAITQSGVIDTVVTAGTVTAAALTNNNASAITGAGAEPGSVLTVTVTDGAGKVQTLTATVAADGKWSITPSALADGKYTVSAIAKDAAGNTSVAATASGIVDTVAPVAGTVNAPDNTNNPTPAISGSGAEANAKIAVTVMAADGTSQSLSAVAAADGTWSVTPAKLPDGEYTVSAVATDAAGNASVAVTDKGSVDTVTSAGKIDAPDNTNDNTPTITATGADAGATITVTITDSAGAKQVLTTTVAADGSWSVTPTSNLADGSYVVTAVAKDAAGNTSTSEDGGSVDSGTTAGTITTAALTNDNTPTIIGASAEAGATITVTVIDGAGATQTLTTIAASDGSWSVTPLSLADGIYKVSAIAKDEIGNISDVVSSSGEIDTLPPSVGTVSASEKTNDNTPLISGSGAEPNATVSVVVTGSDGTKQVLSTVVSQDGSWNVTPTKLADGVYSLTATASDMAGNVSAPVKREGTIDTLTTAGMIKTAALTNDNTPEISGIGAEPGAEILVTVSDAAGVTQTLRTYVDGDGSWKVTSDPLSDGRYTISAVATDELGNISSVANAAGVVDTVPPSPGTLLLASITNDSTPEIKGSGAEPNAKLNVTIIDARGGVQTLTVTVTADGSWTVVPTTLAEGKFDVSVTAVDAAGNESDPVNGSSIVDSAYMAPTIFAMDAATGITGNVVFGSNVLPGSAIKLSFTTPTGIETKTIYADALGAWNTVAPTVPLGFVMNVTAEVSDTRGAMQKINDSGSIVDDTGRVSVTSRSTGSINGSTYEHVTLEGTSQSEALSFNVSNYLNGNTRDGVANLSMGAGNDFVSISGTRANSLYARIDMGSGNDVVLGNQADGRVYGSISTGSGDDTVALYGGFSSYSNVSSDGIFTGAGNDLVELSGGVNTRVVDLGSGVDSISDVNYLYVRSGGFSGSVYGGNGSDNVNIGSNWTGSGVIDLGGGNDSLFISSWGSVANQAFGGGSGYDTLSIGGASSTSKFQGFESIKFSGSGSLQIRFEDLFSDNTRSDVLKIEGSSSSTVDFGGNGTSLADGTGVWEKTGIYTDPVTGKTYNIYHHSSATDSKNDVYVSTEIPNVI